MSRRGSRALRALFGVILLPPLLVVLLHTLVRIVRRFYKFPIPEFLAGAIDNPLRHRLQSPDETAIRHALEPGMVALEVGPGAGTYTMAAARRVGDVGKLVTVDIEPKMIERVELRAEAEGVQNIEARVENVYDLPFEGGTFDAAYMIAVIGEIPEPKRAVRDLYRVLAPGGTLAFSEVLVDPDYPLTKTVMDWVAGSGFRLKEKVGNFFYYTLVFVK